MTWYMKADSTTELAETVQKVMRMHHPKLADAGVTIDCLIARSEDGDPIKVRGIPALGTIRITSSRDRAIGLADAIMTIDGEAMQGWNNRRLQAVIDHELTHLELMIDKRTGETKEDDNGRPRLKLRLHDYEFGWFEATARRYGSDSFEVTQARALMTNTEWVQRFLPGFDSAA